MSFGCKFKKSMAQRGAESVFSLKKILDTQNKFRTIQNLEVVCYSNITHYSDVVHSLIFSDYELGNSFLLGTATEIAVRLHHLDNVDGFAVH